MSAATHPDALEVVQDWDELDTPDEQSAEVQTQQPDTQPDPEEQTQADLSVQREADPATPVAATQQEPADDRLSRLAAENAELQRQIANREWSSQGRLLKAQKELELANARIAEAAQSRVSDDDLRRQQYDAAIAQRIAVGDETGAERLRLNLRAELAERKAIAVEQQANWEKRQREELQAATQEHERTARGRQVQQAFIPMLHAEAANAAAHFGLDEADMADLMAVAAPPSFQYLAQNAPPEVLGQMARTQYDAIVARAEALQRRKVAQNQASFDTTRESGGTGSSRDLNKEFEDAEDWDEALAAIDAGYVPPSSRHRGSRR